MQTGLLCLHMGWPVKASSSSSYAEILKTFRCKSEHGSSFLQMNPFSLAHMLSLAIFINWVDVFTVKVIEDFF